MYPAMAAAGGIPDTMSPGNQPRKRRGIGLSGQDTCFIDNDMGYYTRLLRSVSRRANTEQQDLPQSMALQAAQAMRLEMMPEVCSRSAMTCKKASDVRERITRLTEVSTSSNRSVNRLKRSR